MVYALLVDDVCWLPTAGGCMQSFFTKPVTKGQTGEGADREYCGSGAACVIHMKYLSTKLKLQRTCGAPIASDSDSND